MKCEGGKEFGIVAANIVGYYERSLRAGFCSTAGISPMSLFNKK
ncbi:MAG: hypothetical protein JWR76_1401 [Mucilaginibacter sp.]|nr:hypothetical protein [Mucilaginibacter sp.]